MKISSLQFISQAVGSQSHVEVVEQVLKRGVKWIQLRIKEKSFNFILEQANDCKLLCEQYGAIFIVNDSVEIAKKVKADGVHLGKEDMSPIEARRILGNDCIIGGTANALEDILKLASQKVDYIGLGPYTTTSTKKNLSPVLGLDGYKEIFQELKKIKKIPPVIAVGGIKKEDIELLKFIGLHGVAVSSMLVLS